jgi:hypothetical protein
VINGGLIRMINYLLDVIKGGSPQPGSGGSNAVTSNKES